MNRSPEEWQLLAEASRERSQARRAYAKSRRRERFIKVGLIVLAMIALVAIIVDLFTH